MSTWYKVMYTTYGDINNTSSSSLINIDNVLIEYYSLYKETQTMTNANNILETFVLQRQPIPFGVDLLQLAVGCIATHVATFTINNNNFNDDNNANDITTTNNNNDNKQNEQSIITNAIKSSTQGLPIDYTHTDIQTLTLSTPSTLTTTTTQPSTSTYINEMQYILTTLFQLHYIQVYAQLLYTQHKSQIVMEIIDVLNTKQKLINQQLLIDLEYEDFDDDNNVNMNNNNVGCNDYRISRIIPTGNNVQRCIVCGYHGLEIRKKEQYPQYFP
eukprot:UN01420